MSTLIALTYDDEQSSRTIFELADLQKQRLLQLEDAALATKDAKARSRSTRRWKTRSPAQRPCGVVSGVS